MKKNFLELLMIEIFFKILKYVYVIFKFSMENTFMSTYKPSIGSAYLEIASLICRKYSFTKNFSVTHVPASV